MLLSRCAICIPEANALFATQRSRLNPEVAARRKLDSRMLCVLTQRQKSGRGSGARVRSFRTSPPSLEFAMKASIDLGHGMSLSILPPEGDDPDKPTSWWRYVLRHNDERGNYEFPFWNLGFSGVPEDLWLYNNISSSKVDSIHPELAEIFDHLRTKYPNRVIPPRRRKTPESGPDTSDIVSHSTGER